MAYYRPTQFGQIVIDGQAYDIPEEVRITVFDPVFEDRSAHQQAVLALLPAFAQERCIVFLDPDTGLEPQNPTLDHVLAAEAQAIWNAMKRGDVFSFYQHQTNRAGQPWIEPKRLQLAQALGVGVQDVKTASGPQIAQDAVFFFVQKP